MKPTQRLTRRLILIFLATMSSLALPVQAGITAFLKIPDIPGESRTPDHEDEIDILGYRWNLENRSGNAVDFKELTVSKEVDKSTPLLMSKCATGEVITDVTLVLLRPGATSGTEYFTIAIKNARVTSLSSKGNNSDDVPVEEVTFNYEAIEVIYVPENLDGSDGTPLVFQWVIGLGSPS